MKMRKSSKKNDGIKRNKIGSFVEMWLDLATIILNEVSQKNKYSIKLKDSYSLEEN